MQSLDCGRFSRARRSARGRDDDWQPWVL